jgi:hypothetical protein
MNTMWVAALLSVAALAGCSYTPEWSEYQGPALMKGSGGMVRNVNGMDVWEQGSPPRPYRVLGMMHSEGGRHSDVDFETEQIVKEARAKGGDAIIISSAESTPTGIVGGESGHIYEGAFGATNYSGGFSARIVRSPTVEAYVIKYL